YDIQIFRNCGIHVRGLWFDTMIAAYLLEPGSRRYNLSLLAEKWLGIKMIPLENLIGKGKKELPFSETDVDEACEYACEDAVIPLQLMEKMEPALENCGVKELFRDIEMPLIEVLADMEWNGICVDREFLKELDREYTGVSKEHERKVFEYAGRKFNLNSPKEVGSVLYDELQLPRGRKTKTGRSTDVRELNRLASDYAVARELLEYREVQKLLSTYIRALPQQINKVTKRVHTSFNQTVTASGRLSSTDPNLQNIPIRTEAGHRIRKSFVPDQGMILVAADYSQIELRILAHLSGDDRLKDAFVEDLDIHTQTASAMYQIFPEMVTPEKRRAAKTINFGLIYGMGPVKLSRELKVSYKEAESFIETYFEQFPSVKGYIESVKRDTEEKGYSETEFGRRRYFPDISSSARRVKEAAERSAVNHCVQGTAADIIKLAMIRIAEGIDEKYKDVKLLLQVHDELVFEVPEERVDEFGSWAEDKMSSVYELSVPLRVDTGYGADWSEAH
ncbi:MAG: DNA polymerase I, partial [Chitinivibrionales bacterium]